MDIIKFCNIENSEWDRHIHKLTDSTYMHSSWWINYLNAVNGIENDKSFIILEGDNPLGACTLTVPESNVNGTDYQAANFIDISNPCPAIAELPATQRRRLLRKVFNIIYEILMPYKIKKIEFYKHPVNINFLKGAFDGSYQAEVIALGYIGYVKNTIIVDLTKGEEELLSEVTAYQRKHIRKSAKQGLLIKELRGSSRFIGKAFNDYQSAHFKSAGRLTRPQASWDIMKELLKKEKATLFIATIDGHEISYLYCGEFGDFSFGWSQVNLNEHEKIYSPRHLLEWEAMMTYKRRGFRYYEVGIQYGLPQIQYFPTYKDITISQFKERYGGKLYCYLYFEKFLDKELFTAVYKERIERISSSDCFGSMEDSGEPCKEQ